MGASFGRLRRKAGTGGGKVREEKGEDWDGGATRQEMEVASKGRIGRGLRRCNEQTWCWWKSLGAVRYRPLAFSIMSFFSCDLCLLCNTLKRTRALPPRTVEALDSSIYLISQRSEQFRASRGHG